MARGRRPSAEDPIAWKARYRTWSSVSMGRTCDGCEEAVGAAEIQHDVDVNGTIVLRLHPECLRAWLDGG